MALSTIGRNQLNTGIDDNSDATAVTINSSENVGIGTASPSSYDGESDNLVVASSGHTGVTIASTGSNQRTNLYFADGTSGTAKYIGGFTYNHSDNSLLIRTNGAERARVTDNGLTFNGDTAAANALDDYEEGFFTPTDASGQGLTITNNGSSYVKIGKLVHVNLYITFPVTNNSTQAKISLPYGAAGASSGYSYLNGRLQNGAGHAFESAFTCQINAGSNAFQIGYHNTTNSQIFTYNNVDGRYLLVSGTYVSDT